LNEIATPLPGLAMTIKNSFHSDDRLKFSFIVACYSGDNCERSEAISNRIAGLLDEIATSLRSWR